MLTELYLEDDPTNQSFTVVNNSLDFNSTLQHEFVCIKDTESESFSYVFETCVYCMYFVVFAVSLFGNGLVCLVVQITPQMKTVTNFFIANLAVGDILMTLFCVPFSFISVLILKYWPFGAAMCKIVNFSQAVSVLISAYTLLAICIDRYLVVTRPLRPRLSKRVAKVVVSCVWIGAVVTAAPIFVVSELQKPSLWHEVCELDICAEQWPTPQQAQRYSCLLLALQFALPLTVLVWTYARIACLVWGKRPPGEAETTRDNRIQYSKRKMLKMMVIVVIVFVVCWLPLNLFILVWTSHEEEWAVWAGAPYVWFACHWLAMSHSCYNPIIYCYMNSRYREGFKQVFIDLFRLKAHSANRDCHRSSFCEVLPLSEMVGVNTLYYKCGRVRNGNGGVGPILCHQKKK